MKKTITILVLLTTVYGQYSDEQVLQILEDRDAQWKDEIEEVELLVDQQDMQMVIQEELISKLSEQAIIDSTIISTKNQQIELLASRENANKKIISLVKPRWYQNEYLWFVAGFLLGK